MTPAVRLEVGGKPASSDLLARLVSLTMTDESGDRADTCELVIDGRGGVTPPGLGTEIRLWMGYEPAPAYRGRFRVTGWNAEGPPLLLTVRANAADLTSSIRAPKMRSFHEMTVKQIVEQVAREHGLEPLIDEAIGARSIAHIDQQMESDVGFLTRLARRNGAVFKVGAGRVILAAQGSISLPDGTKKQRVTLRPADVSLWSMRKEGRWEYGSASATYIDPQTKKRKAARSGRGGLRHRDRHPYGSLSEAEAAAAANLSAFGREHLSGSLEAPGLPDLYAEALMSLQGFGPGVDGIFLAKTVEHSFSKTGYRSSVFVETIGAPAE